MTTPAFMEGENVLYDLLTATLDAIVEVFEEEGVDLPDRRYVAFGTVAADCEQLTVALDQHYMGTPGGDPNALTRCGGPRTVAMTVQLFRTTAAQTARQATPSVASLSKNAEKHLRDAWVLLNAAERVDSIAWGTGVIAEVTAAEAAGGLVGCNMSLVVPVP